MASFEVVNYSLRPSKNIQRQVMFSGISLLKSRLEIADFVYVGFGSVWFTDFVMAHKALEVRDMVSIEANPIGYRRATFNKPFSTVCVRRGYSTQVLEDLYVDISFGKRPWIIWLDYDTPLDETVSDDIRSVIENAPDNSIFLLTFSGRNGRYGSHAIERKRRLQDLLGAVVPDYLDKGDFIGDRIQDTLATLVLDFMKAVAAQSFRKGGFKPAFRAIYKDTTPMVTIGGVLPSGAHSELVGQVIEGEGWNFYLDERIVAPLLTLREAAALQSLLPMDGNLSRETVQNQGFDLDEEQIAMFQKYYREYPMFAQIVA